VLVLDRTGLWLLPLATRGTNNRDREDACKKRCPS